MLPLSNRIKKKKDFEAFFSDSKTFKRDSFVLKIKKNNLGLNRAGFIISRKVSKKATDRSRTRRRFSEAIRPKIKDIKNGADLLFIVLPGADKKSFSEIESAVSSALKEAGLIPK